MLQNLLHTSLSSKLDIKGENFVVIVESKSGRDVTDLSGAFVEEGETDVFVRHERPLLDETTEELRFEHLRHELLRCLLATAQKRTSVEQRRAVGRACCWRANRKQEVVVTTQERRHEAKKGLLDVRFHQILKICTKLLQTIESVQAIFSG